MAKRNKIPMNKEKNFHLKGDKVLLRLFMESNIDDSYIGWLNDPAVVQFSNQRFITHNRESCMCYLASFEGTSNMFVSVQKVSGGCQIGTMTAYVSPHHGTVDCGIMIGEKSLWGKDYGQEAWDLLTEYLLQRKDIRKLTAGTMACNYGMIKILENSGMVLEAVRKEQEILEGNPMDLLYYAKFNVD